MCFRFLRIGITLVCAGGLACLAMAQEPLTYTYSFTETLKQHGLEFYQPVENWLHVAGHREDGYLDYDLVLENDINDFEVRYRIRGHLTDGNRVPQQVELTRALASISINSAESEIRMRLLNEAFSRERFNAESAIFAEFMPKPTFSNKPYGTYISLYSTEYGAVDLILLYYDQEYDPLDSFVNLRFIE